MGYIWTNHAIKRLNERKIPQNLAIQVFSDPDRSVTNKDGSVELQKRIDNKTVAVIIKENERGEKIIVSCWINPPNPGTKDFKRKARYYEMQKSSPLKKLWLTLLDQLGL